MTPSPAAAVPVRSGHLPINGLQMYYEVHGAGAGTPLVLLHGGGSTIDSTYGRILPWLARHRQVIALEEQAHGRTSDRDAPERFETSADDVDALLGQLGVATADVMGFSNGASVALQVAIRHPARVRRLVFASSMTRRAGTAPAFWDGFPHASFADMPQSLKDAFLKVNPDPQKLRRMFDRDVERMRSFRDVPDAEVAGVTIPVLVISGDRDVPTIEHAVELSRMAA
jgi:pimeloyl-ACP methyl ester carboxylesterase